MFILREFQKRATVTLAFVNVRGSHSSAVQNNSDVKCLMVNRESDLIIQTTTVASVWETWQKIPSWSYSQLWVFAVVTQEGNQINLRKVSCLLCPCWKVNSFSLWSSPHRKPELKKSLLKQTGQQKYWDKAWKLSWALLRESHFQHPWKSSVYEELGPLLSVVIHLLTLWRGEATHFWWSQRKH